MLEINLLIRKPTKLSVIEMTKNFLPPKLKYRLEPPRSGGNALGGIQNALAGLGGNTSPRPRQRRGRGQSFFKFGNVDPGRIELPLVQCECTVMPLNYGPTNLIRGEKEYVMPFYYEPDCHNILQI